MLKKLMISAAVSALMVSGAMAQADTAEGRRAEAEAPKADANRRIREVHFVAEHGSVGVLEVQGHRRARPRQRAGRRRERLLFDKNGKIIGLIVGVGGFLGIGEKSVAIDMSAFQVVPASTGSTTGAAAAASAATIRPT